jgi:hypothetical protein
MKQDMKKVKYSDSVRKRNGVMALALVMALLVVAAAIVAVTHLGRLSSGMVPQLNSTPAASAVAQVVTSFTEKGLPQGSQFSITYGGITNSTTVTSSAPTLLFLTPSGSQAYAVPNITYNGKIYYITDPTGSVPAGLRVSLTYLVVNAPATAVSSAVEITGPVYSITNSVSSVALKGAPGTYSVNASFPTTTTSTVPQGYAEPAVSSGGTEPYSFYLCAVTEGESKGSCAPGTVCPITNLSFVRDVYNSSSGADVAAIGHQPFDGCSAKTTDGGLAAISVGLSGVTSNYLFYPSVRGPKFDMQTVNYTVPASAPSSLVVIMAACSSGECIGIGNLGRELLMSMTGPQNCTWSTSPLEEAYEEINSSATADGNESAIVKICPYQKPGTYKVTVMGDEENQTEVAGVYVFPPMGTYTTTVSTTSTTTTSTTTTVPPTFFTEQGLPIGATFNVAYYDEGERSNLWSNSITANATSNTIVFFTKDYGYWSYSIANSIINGVQYTPNPQSGALMTGSGLVTTFAANQLLSLPAGGSLPPSIVLSDLNRYLAPNITAANDTMSNLSVLGVYMYSGYEAVVVGCNDNSTAAYPCLIEFDFDSSGDLLNVTSTT